MLAEFIPPTQGRPVIIKKAIGGLRAIVAGESTLGERKCFSTNSRQVHQVL
jgi:hypothetical protein